MLSDFGLSNTQAKVYVSIVQLGLARVGEISKFSKVRREDVYRALPKLEKMGLIEKTLGTPTKIKAAPLEEALSLLIKRQQDEAAKRMSELIIRVGEFVKDFKAKKTLIKAEEKGPQFSLISEKGALFNKNATMIMNSKKQIDIISSRKKLTKFFYTSADLFKKAVNKGVTIRIITDRPTDEDLLLKIMKERIALGYAIDLRYTDGLPSHYIISDAKEALITTSTEAYPEESPSLWTNNSGVILLLQKNFGDIWFFASMPRTAINPK